MIACHAKCSLLTCFNGYRELMTTGSDFTPDGGHFDHLFDDGETFSIGRMTATAILTPGHTPADLSYQIDDAIFVGDTRFMPDLGTARADFPGRDARRLFRSIPRLLAHPAETRLFICHDYAPASRTIRWKTTVAERRAHNIMCTRHRRRPVRGHAASAGCHARHTQSPASVRSGKRACGANAACGR